MALSDETVKSSIDLYVQFGRFVPLPTTLAKFLKPPPRLATDAEVREWWKAQQGDVEYRPKPMPEPNTKKKEGGCKGCSEKKNKKSVMNMASGALKIGKAMLGVDYVGDEKTDQRWSICMNCDKNDHGICSECGCSLAQKVRLTKERCPLGKWGD